MRGIRFIFLSLLFPSCFAFADAGFFSPESLKAGENHFVNIDVVEQGGKERLAELSFRIDSLGGVAVDLFNPRGFFRGERGRPIRNFHEELSPEEGKVLLKRVASSLPSRSNPEGGGGGATLVRFTVGNGATGELTVREWTQGEYDIEPIMTFLDRFVRNTSPGEISVLASDGYVRVYRTGDPGKISNIDLSPENGYVDVIVDNAANIFDLPARISAYGGVCKAKLDAIDVYQIAEGFRMTFDSLPISSLNREALEIEIFLPMDDGTVEYIGGPKENPFVFPTSNLMRIIENLVRLCAKEAYYPERITRGLGDKKKLKRPK